MADGGPEAGVAEGQMESRIEGARAVHQGIRSEIDRLAARVWALECEHREDVADLAWRIAEARRVLPAGVFATDVDGHLAEAALALSAYARAADRAGRLIERATAALHLQRVARIVGRADDVADDETARSRLEALAGALSWLLARSPAAAERLRGEIPLALRLRALFLRREASA